MRELPMRPALTDLSPSSVFDQSDDIANLHLLAVVGRWPSGLLDRREGGEPGVSSPGLAAPGTSSSRNRGSYAVSAFGGPSWTPVRLAPAARSSPAARNVALTALRPASWTPCSSSREASALSRRRASLCPTSSAGLAARGTSTSRSRSSCAVWWRRGESNPGPRGFQLNFVHVRSRIARAAGFPDSAGT